MRNSTSIVNCKKAFLTTLFTFVLLVCANFNSELHAQGIATGVTFDWADTQADISDPATIESITIDGKVYNTFVVPSTYEMTRVGPIGDNGNNIWRNGTNIVSGSNDPNWTSEALSAYQSINLNHYFESNDNGTDFCGDFSAVATTDTQIQTISYDPGIPSNPDGILAVTERGGNNCQYIELYGIPNGGTTEAFLGATFIRQEGNLTGVQPQAPPLPNSDYWTSGRNNNNGQVIGIGLFELSDLAPVGSIITAIKYYAATVDNGDGKFFLMQTYAVDDIFESSFEEVFTGDASANDNVPVNSSYTLSGPQPANGTVVVNSDGTFTYTPDNGFLGTDTFDIEVCLPAPNTAVCNISSARIEVKADNTPTAIDDTYSISEDTVNTSFTVLDNDDFGLDGPQVNTALTIITNPSNGTASVNNNGTLSNPLDDFIVYTPNSFYQGTDSLTYEITDSNGSTDTAIVTITVTPDTTKSINITTTDISVNEAIGLATITVQIQGTYQVGPTITYETLSNSALAGEDYTPVSNTHTFAGTPGETFSFTIPIIDDSLIESTEVLDVEISSSSYAAPIHLATTVSILDNDMKTIIANTYEKEYTIICGDEIPEVPALQFSQGCGDYEVEFTEIKEFTTTSADFMIVRTWNVTDSCGNAATFEQLIFVMQREKEFITIDICITEEAIDLISYLPATFDTNGTFTITQGVGLLNGTSFNPADFEIGTYTILYNTLVDSCVFEAEFSITVTDDCVECDKDDVIVSTAVTPNGDGFNDVFAIRGAENCTFQFDVMIFNRWGQKVYEGKDYQNDWAGSSPNGSFGDKQILPTGTYYYIANIVNKPELGPLNGYIYLGTE